MRYLGGFYIIVLPNNSWCYLQVSSYCGDSTHLKLKLKVNTSPLKAKHATKLIKVGSISI